MTSKRALRQLAGNDRRNSFFLKPTEKSFYLQAKDAGICDACKDRFDGIQNNTFGANGINRMF
jgi:hypothetical protein